MGPVVLLPPILLLIYGIVWFRQNPPGGGSRSLGELSEASGQVAPQALRGFEGLAQGAGGHGARLFARLTPLQAGEGWQRHDAEVLRERLGLGEGEPWRLELVQAPGEDAGPIGLLPAAVADARGRALRSLETLPGAETSPDGGAPPVVDPLRALVTQPARELGAGEEVQLVLWGRRPGDDARLLLGVEGASGSVPLAETSVPAEDLARSLARVTVGQLEDGDGEEERR